MIAPCVVDVGAILKIESIALMTSSIVSARTETEREENATAKISIEKARSKPQFIVRPIIIFVF